MTITEKKELVAEFMGGIYSVHAEAWGFGNARIEPKEIKSKNKVYKNLVWAQNFEKELKYNSSWDWLMPIIKKIHELGYVCVFYGNYCFIQDILSFKNKPSVETKELFIQQYCKQEEELITAVFEAVVWFVEWYNENLK